MNILIAAGVFGLVPAIVIIAVVMVWRSYRRQAKQAGYASVGDYLRAAPRSDEEKRKAVDLALKGLVICLLGLLFPPLLLIGLFPFFHGSRKIVYASMGLGLVDDAEPPSA